MTINVALVTSEAVIFGCDSIASSTQLFLNPLGFVERDDASKIVLDQHGRMVARFAFRDLQHVVTDAWGGVRKLFRLCEDRNPVAAVTSGLAALNGKNIAAIADAFNRTGVVQQHSTIDAVVRAFVDRLGAEFDAHYAATGDPPEFRSDVELLIGGYGQDDSFPSLYRVKLAVPPEHRISKIYGVGEGFSGRVGVAWAGQADGVERLLFGYDGALRTALTMEIAERLDTLHREMSESVAHILGQVIAALGIELPAGINTELPPKSTLSLNWEQFQVNIDFANLPIQDAVDLVAYLVNLQSGKAKFIRGVPTVGGRTHIGIIDRQGFRMLNEPETIHRNTGYAREL